jgi:adenosylcobinamide-GDP ribazoletransferase
MRRAMAFLTPLGRSAVPSRAALVWFPAVGTVVGAAVGSVWWVAGRWWPALVAGVLAVVADAALTGGLHLDGVADAADGLLPPLPAPRRLEVMADPHVGAFGVCALVLVLMLRVAAFAAVPATIMVVAGIWCASRTAMAVTAQVLTYVRPGGLATAFVEPGGGAGPLAVGAAGAVLALGLGALGRGWRGALSVACAMAGFAAVAVFARRRIGGFTGDVLGAAGVVGETIGLLALAASW